MRAFRHLILLAGLAGMLGGCATMPRQPGPEQRAAAAQAEQLQQQGRFQTAAHAWLQLADRYRGHRDAYLLQAAESWRQLDAWSEAAPLLERIRRDRLSPDQATHLDLLLAGAALAGNDPATALLRTTGAHSLSAPWRLRALELRARAQQATGDTLAAARTRLIMNPELSGFDRSQNEQQLSNLLHGVDSASLQAKAEALDANDPLRAWIGNELEARGLALPNALPKPQHPLGTLLPDPTLAVAVSPEGYVAPTSVALLLPISGPLSAAGLAVQDGFFTAWQAHGQQTEDMLLNVIDTGGSAAGTLAAYQQAVAAGNQLVVGPLAPDSVAALFQRAPLPVPVLALNHPVQGLPPAGSSEFALPPEAEGAQAAAYMLAHGLSRAVVFLGDVPWAARAGRAFRAQFEAGGGQVLDQAILSSNEVNYAATIDQRMAGADASTGVFLAMPPSQGRLLVPQLRIAGVSVPLIATSHIYDVLDNAGLNRDLDGVIFCDAPWLLDARPGPVQRSALVAENPHASGPAARLFAFGMDAFALMPYLAWMQQHPGSYLDGATGQLSMDSLGRIHRTPIWARFVNGVAVPVTGALTADPSTTAP